MQKAVTIPMKIQLCYHYWAKNLDPMDYGNNSYHDLISTEMLENSCDGGQSHPNVNRRESYYKIHDQIIQIQLEQKGVLKAMQHIDKGVHKVFKNVVKYI